MSKMFVVKSLFLLAVCTSTLAQRVPSKDLQTPEYVLSAKLQLPKEEDPPKFDSYLPIPNEGEDGDELVPPNEEAWNPNKDPSLYYGTEENTATNVYPKKYNKDVVEKIKPFLTKPKDEEVLAKQKDIPLTLTPPSEAAWNPNNDPIYYYDTEKPSANILSEILYNPNLEDKKNYNYEKAQNQRQVKEVKEPISSASSSSSFSSSSSSSPSLNFAEPNSKGQRVEFQIHGYDGPKSYKWGYDTGKGHNRQFRYEERDKDGYVKGHYGYFDTHGKLKLVHYDSHPHDGFHAEGPY